MWRRSEVNKPIGLIAGKGDFPVLFAKAAFSMKRPLIVFGVEGYTDRRVEEFAAESYYVDLGSLEKLVENIKRSGIKEAVLAGGVPKKEIYNPSFQMDDSAKSLIHTTKNKGDDHLLRSFQVFLKVKCGVSILDSRIFLKNTTATRGVMTARKPTPEEIRDLRLGWKVARGIGRMDIGQTVVVKNGVVLAVEAIEGTDKAIERGSELGRGGAVVVKAAKPNQSLRFDLPCVGMETLETLKNSSSKVLGVEAGKTIMIFKEKLIEMANQNQMTIVGL